MITIKHSKKKKRIKHHRPRNFLDGCQSLMHVAGFPPQHELISTPVALDFVKEIFLDRFVKEIVKPFQPRRNRRKNENTLPTLIGSTHITTTNSSNSSAGYCHTVMIDGKLVKKRRLSKQCQEDEATTTATATATATAKISAHHNNPQVDANMMIENDEWKREKRIWKECIVIGSNQCSRVLETVDAASLEKKSHTTKCSSAYVDDDDKNVARSSVPSLIVLARDIHPPTMCCAVPVLARRLGIPILLLPGKASADLGKVLNMKRTSILVFLSNNRNNNGDDINSKTDDDRIEKEIRNARIAVDSFVMFIKDQMSGSSNCNQT